ncbi:lysylphosphatidylglycerol synthase transmembrane domain-containing protein [Balneolales bacterium ANBcel1]|nr:lysylphosphatidylglycerol synthase transmembrane domain-containing protein [Balneolales bacterium ANBcel1]
MMHKYLRLILSLAVALLFLWLALKDVSFYEVRLTLNTLTYYWLLPYLVISLASHYLRAERWRLLIEQGGVKTSRLTLFSGVMLGYLVNYAVPRLGELSRSVFVGNREQISRTKLIGTVVLERALDLAVMLVLIVFVFVYLFRDYTLFAQIFGEETILWIKAAGSVEGIQYAIILLLSAVVLLLAGYLLFRLLSSWIPAVANAKRIFTETSIKFLKGLISIKDVKNWPLFLLLTAGIWFCYVLMTYIPFTAFNMHTEFNLGLQEAMVITVISALGVAIPSPGGIGTYHWFVSRSLLLLFAVPEATGVAYAIVTHLVMMIIILVFTPVLLAIHKTRNNRQGISS